MGFLREHICGFGIFDRYWLIKMQSNGLWSVVTISSGHPRSNILAFSKDHVVASVSHSVGEYWLSVDVVNLESVNTNFQLSEQHTGVFSSEQLQYF